MTDSTTKAAAPKASAEDPPKPPPRAPEVIKADLEQARQSLVSNVDAIQEYVKPANMAARTGRRFKRIYVSADGSPNVKAIAITVAVVGVYVLYRIRK